MPRHEAGTIVAQLIQMGIPLSKKECCCPGCGATRGMRGMLFGIASGTIWASKKSLHNILRDDDKTLSRGV